MIHSTLNSLFTKAGYLFAVIRSRFGPLRKEFLFMSFNGHYSDSPKAISEKIHEMHPEEPITWLVSRERMGELPSYVNGVDIKSDEAYMHLLTAKVIIDNIYCRGGLNTIGTVSYYKNKMMYAFTRRKGQIKLSTWHGTPLKKMGIDIRGSKENSFLGHPLTMVHGNQHTLDVMDRITFHQIEMHLIGSPRNDVLFSSEKGMEVKKKLGLDATTKIMLYAPTFRSDGNGMSLLNVKRSGIDQMDMIDFDKLFACLTKKFGGEWVFIGRFHNFVEKEVDWKKLNNKYQGRIINGNNLDDMADYLSCTDVLLTDSSSCMFDFSLTGKPCLLFFPDLKEYKEKERGLYYDIEQLPFPCAVSFDELLELIQDFSNDYYMNGVKFLLQTIGNVDDGNASVKVVRYIYEKINS